MRLPTTAHTERPWRIHEVAPDLEVEDVWLLDTPGGPDDLARLVHQLVDDDFPEGAPLPVRFLWEARWKLGALLGWDDERATVGARVASLRDRLPADLHEAPAGPAMPPFGSVYLLPEEWAAELANRTVHTVLHLGWVADEDGTHRARMAVLVKPNGWWGRAYMTAIKPFRYLVVYPALIRRIERQWRASGTAPASRR